MNRPSPLAIAIAASVAVHGLMLSLNFAFPELKKALTEPTLDVILVNARSKKKPVDAQAIAQANLDGGGDLDESRRAKSPLPTTAQDSSGNDLEQMRRRMNELEAMQQQLMTKAKSLRTAPTVTQSANQPDPSPTLSGHDLLETAKAMARLEGEIAKDIDTYNKRPRKLFPGTRAMASERALYEDAWRQKVERLGTANYPPEARGKTYGSLVLTVILDRDGEVKEVTIDKSSGQRVLDEAAKRIVRMGSPYGALPPGIRQQYDQLVIIRTWNFTQGNALETKQ